MEKIVDPAWNVSKRRLHSVSLPLLPLKCHLEHLVNLTAARNSQNNMYARTTTLCLYVSNTWMGETKTTKTIRVFSDFNLLKSWARRRWCAGVRLHWRGIISGNDSFGWDGRPATVLTQCTLASHWLWRLAFNCIACRKHLCRSLGRTTVAVN